DFSGFLAQDLEFLGAKALVAQYGPEPRLESIGFVFPPILLYGALIVGSPITLQVLLGALLVGLLARKLTALPIAAVWRWSWLLLIVVHPAFVLMLVASPAWTLTTFFLMLVSTQLWGMVNAGSLESSPVSPSMFSLVLLGLGLAPLMLLRYEAWLLLLVTGVILGLRYHQEPWPFQSTIIAMTLFMSLVFIGAWLYANWLFTGDVAQFLTSPYSGLRLPGTEMFVQQAGFWASWREAGVWIAYVVPAYMVTAAWVLWHTPRRILALCILLIPLMFPAVALWQGSFVPQLSRFGMVLGMLPLLWRQCPLTRFWQRSLITAMLMISVGSSAFLLQAGQQVPEETYLWRIFTHQSLPPASSVGQWADQQQAKRQVAEALSRHLSPGQHVLLDDVASFPVVYLVNDSRPFIMPYQYEFVPALQHPNLFADFILVSGANSPTKEQDRVLRFWPELEHGVLPHYTELVSTPFYRLLQRVSPQ
ncbi:MAG TPA: hypothetical protein VGC99_25040, partial [Candidatus Tectomicrobia bacterium]